MIAFLPVDLEVDGDVIVSSVHGTGAALWAIAAKSPMLDTFARGFRMPGLRTEVCAVDVGL